MRKRIKTRKNSEQTYWDYVTEQEGTESLEANPDLLAAPADPETFDETIALQLKAIEEAKLTGYERMILDFIQQGESILAIAAKLERHPSSINSAIKQARAKIHRTYTRLRLIYRLKGDL